MTILEFIRSWLEVGKGNHIKNLFITSVLKQDLREAFQDIETQTYYKSFGKVELLIGKDFNLILIMKRSEITIFYCEDLDQDDSYLALKYGKILLEEI